MDDGKPEARTFRSAISALLDKATEQSSPDAILKHAKQPQISEAEKKEREQKRQAKDNHKRKLQQELFLNRSHTIPEVATTELETKLRKVGTRGVVQLMNAIKLHQKIVPLADEEDRERTDAATKRKFMQTLREKGAKNSKHDDLSSDDELAPKKTLARKATASGKSWEVLRDDYMLGASMKDWNKESDEE